MTFVNDIRTAEAGIVDRIWEALRVARERSDRRRVYRRTLEELSDLTPRELGDLGISPNNIREIAHKAAYDN